MNQPVCGYCRHDLTGSEVNRCPMCKLLLIDAGVLIQPSFEGRRIQRRRILFLLLFIGFAAVSIIPVSRAEEHARLEADAALENLAVIRVQLFEHEVGYEEINWAWTGFVNPLAEAENQRISDAAMDSQRFSYLTRRIKELETLP